MSSKFLVGSNVQYRLFLGLGLRSVLSLRFVFAWRKLPACRPLSIASWQLTPLFVEVASELGAFAGADRRAPPPRPWWLTIGFGKGPQRVAFVGEI